jgi:hypothetical protein
VTKPKGITRIKAGPYSLKVMHTPTLTDDGDWNAQDHVIQVRLKDDALTILHEAIHAISDLNGLGLSENKVRGLEYAIGALLADNPDLTRALLKGSCRAG